MADTMSPSAFLSALTALPRLTPACVITSSMSLASTPLSSTCGTTRESHCGGMQRALLCQNRTSAAAGAGAACEGAAGADTGAFPTTATLREPRGDAPPRPRPPRQQQARPRAGACPRPRRQRPWPPPCCTGGWDRAGRRRGEHESWVRLIVQQAEALDCCPGTRALAAPSRRPARAARAPELLGGCARRLSGQVLNLGLGARGGGGGE